MKYSNGLPWLPALLVLSACPGKPPEPAAQLSAISVSCAPATVLAGQSVQCTASATDQKGEPFSVSGYTWTSSDEAMARVDAMGKASTLAVSSGPVVIRASATAGDVTRQGEATINVTPKDPTVHSTSITTAETWREADNPHLVRGQLVVDASATLTLEAGVVVRFAPDAELRMTDGALLARGTQMAPIVLEAEARAARGSWRGLVFSTLGSASTLEHVTVSGCGAAGGEGACVSVREQAAPVLRDVSVRESGSVGVLVADDGSAFGAGSARLSVSGSAGYAVRLGASRADSFPMGGAFSGNSPNAVELNGHVSRTLTWPNPGIPFVIPALMNVENPISAVTLTISAGTQLRFGANAQLVVGYPVPQSILKVDGTADAPVLFTADAASPTPGHWRGVHVLTPPSNAGHIHHAIFEYAGAEIDSSERFNENGNLNIYAGEPDVGFASFVLSDVVARRGKGAGIVMISQAIFGEGSARITSTENGSYALVGGANTVGSMPTDSKLRGNALDMVKIDGGRIVTTQTWPNLGLPYVIAGSVYVGYYNRPTLTLPPGTDLRFQADTAFVVGGSPNEMPGILLAQGTAAAPIRFVPDVSSAPRGHWWGLHFWMAEGSRLDHVLVTHGGTFEKGYPESGIIGSGNVTVHREIGPFITNSTFREALGNPICVSDGRVAGSTRVDTQFFNPELNNTAVDNPEDFQDFCEL
ncbi:hypothetical protein ACN28I_07160 [Archangium gephyra]|uniref:hypothetical protein n=1 Tax=Archangium gephyra TaxID=48 RepID=UPI003B7EA6BD